MPWLNFDFNTTIESLLKEYTINIYYKATSFHTYTDKHLRIGDDGLLV